MGGLCSKDNGHITDESDPSTQNEEIKRSKDQRKANQEIDKALGEYERQQQKITCRLMLVGIGESGKTTLLRQMKQQYGQPYTISELRDAAPHILKNLVEAMRTLALYSELLAEQGEPTSVSKDNESIRNRVATLENEEFTPELCEQFQKLWEDVI
ncbi:GNAS complex locus isoform 1 [Reticulomyxa filosa]|uniref:GNAS complex locus isoform 1 n=1 Tax=Reticulomyxa filosa TaxID=46433 RepID=X6NIM0_RETFI|nr:GNAS complex locus isoform 1 [Reticulomyxa filosa]|eukprot:ETO26175.1 GNAS complex locus isoform 1 [Reticulomyxa filosa]